MYVTLETIGFKHLILVALPNSFVSSLFHFVSCIIFAVMQYPIAVIIHKVSNVDHLLSQGCQLRPHISGSSFTVILKIRRQQRLHDSWIGCSEF